MTKKTVLVVEDEPLVRMLVVDFLDDLGFQASEAGDGQEALNILGAEPDIALLITDIGLPGMDGKALAEAVRALRPQMGILLATGQGEGQEMMTFCKSIRAGMISKPFDLDDLSRKIKAIMSL